MMTHPGSYSIIQFCPDRARAEVMNVGVLLICPELRYGDGRHTTTVERVRRFFHESAGDAARIHREVQGIINRLRQVAPDMSADDFAKHVAVESSNRFVMTTPRYVAVDNPAALLDELFDLVVGEAKVHSESKPRALPELKTLSGRLSREGVPVRPSHRVEVPALERDLVSDFAYRNGAINLVKGHFFYESSWDKSASKLGTEGLLLSEHKIEDEKHALIVVARFEKPRLQERVSQVLRPHRVKLFEASQLPQLEQTVRSEAKPWN